MKPPASLPPVRQMRVLHLCSTAVLCWLGFLAVHEFGHILMAWLTGGRLTEVVLHPAQISWSAFAPNPRPLLVAWGGPVLGAFLPVLAWWGARAVPWSREYLLRAFAGFCLLANGSYLLIDAFERSGDGGALLRHGAAVWQLLTFALIAMPVGGGLWRGLGPQFGFGPAARKVSRRDATVVALMAVLIAALEVVVSR